MPVVLETGLWAPPMGQLWGSNVQQRGSFQNQQHGVMPQHPSTNLSRLATNNEHLVGMFGKPSRGHKPCG